MSMKISILHVLSFLFVTLFAVVVTAQVKDPVVTPVVDKVETSVDSVATGFSFPNADLEAVKKEQLDRSLYVVHTFDSVFEVYQYRFDSNGCLSFTEALVCGAFYITRK